LYFAYGLVKNCLWKPQFSAPADFWSKGVPLATILWNPRCQLGQWTAKHNLWCTTARCCLVGWCMHFLLCNS